MSFLKKKLLAMVLLCLTSGIVYQACFFICSTGQDVGVFFFEWERNIPFLPWTVVLYTFFFVLFPVWAILVKSDKELFIVIKRCTFIVVISAIFFVVFPLRAGFDKPQVFGFLGLLFKLVHYADVPYNMAPSLHVSTLTIAWSTFSARIKGIFRFIIGILFLSIVLSTLTTYQHHIIDIISGVLLGTISVYLFKYKKAR